MSSLGALSRSDLEKLREKKRRREAALKRQTLMDLVSGPVRGREGGSRWDSA